GRKQWEHGPSWTHAIAPPRSRAPQFVTRRVGAGACQHPSTAARSGKIQEGDMAKMPFKRCAVVGLVLSTVSLSGCSMFQNKDLETQNAQLQSQVQQLQTQNQQLQQQVAAQTEQITRLQGAIKYTVNSDLLFAPGSWEISQRGQDVMAKIASQLAPFQQNH